MCNPMNENTDYFDKLVSKALDSSLTFTETEKLQSLLKSSKALQKRYCNTILLESLLHWEDTEVTASDEKVIPFPIWPFAASFAAVFICMLSAWAIYHFSIRKAVVFDKFDPYVDSKAFDSQPSPSMSKLSIESPLPSLKHSSSLIDKARSIIANLTDGSEITPGLSLFAEETFTVISLEQKLSTPTIHGVMPLRDGNMLQLSDMDIDPNTRKSSVFETLRIYEFKEIESLYDIDVDASIHINQSYSDVSDQTEFVLSLHALTNAEDRALTEIGSSAQAITSDNDQSTWEKIDTTFSLPVGTEYLVVSLAAKKSGLGALSAHKHNFFADELELSFAGI